MASGSDATSGTGQPDDARQRIVADDGAGALVVVPTFNERDNHCLLYTSPSPRD